MIIGHHYYWLLFWGCFNELDSKTHGNGGFDLPFPHFMTNDRRYWVEVKIILLIQRDFAF